MDEKDVNVTTNEGLTDEQRELLTQFAARSGRTNTGAVGT